MGKSNYYITMYIIYIFILRLFPGIVSRRNDQRSVAIINFFKNGRRPDLLILISTISKSVAEIKIIILNCDKVIEDDISPLNPLVSLCYLHDSFPPYKLQSFLGNFVVPFSCFKQSSKIYSGYTIKM